MMDESGRWYIGDDVATLAFKSGPKAAAAARAAAVAETSDDLGDADTYASRSIRARALDRINAANIKGMDLTGTDDCAAAFSRLSDLIRAKQAARTNSTYTGGIEVWLPQGDYLLTSGDGIDWTGLRDGPVIFRGFGARILGKLAAKNIVDLSDSRYWELHGIEVVGLDASEDEDGSGYPNVGVLCARRDDSSGSQFPTAAINAWDRTKVYGSFVQAAYYNFASEEHAYNRCKFRNDYAGGPARTVYLTCQNMLGVTSDYVTIGAQYVANQPLNAHDFYRPDFRQGGSMASGDRAESANLVLEGVYNVMVRMGYSNVYSARQHTLLKTHVPTGGSTPRQSRRVHIDQHHERGSDDPLYYWTVQKTDTGSGSQVDFFLKDHESVGVNQSTGKIWCFDGFTNTIVGLRTEMPHQPMGFAAFLNTATTTVKGGFNFHLDSSSSTGVLDVSGFTDYAGIVRNILTANITKTTNKSALLVLNGSSVEVMEKLANTTIASGVATLTETRRTVRLRGEGSAADDLNTVTITGVYEGMVIRLQAITETITLKHATSGTDVLTCRGGADVALANGLFVEAVRVGNKWYVNA